MSHAEISPAAGDTQTGRHGPADAHPAHLAHHFDTPKQQFESAKLGMWVFLATELLMFGGLFCAYAVWRANNYEAFAIGHQYLDSMLGAVNTIVLIASSFTMAWAVRAIQLNQQRLCLILLSLTFLGGVGFMCIKGVEYSAKFSHGLGPGIWYSAPAHAPGTLAATRAPALPIPADPDAGPGPAYRTILPGAAGTARGFELPIAAEIDPQGPKGRPPILGEGSGEGAAAGESGHSGGGHGGYFASLGHDAQDVLTARPFISIYFLMTALHGIHVLIGMGIIAWLIVRVARGAFGPAFNTPVDLGGLYWHLVDLIWIFLFPLLYLI